MKRVFCAAAILTLTATAAFACGTQITDPFPCSLMPTPEEIQSGHYQQGHWHVDDYRRWQYQNALEHYKRYKGLPGAIKPPTPPEMMNWHSMTPTGPAQNSQPAPQQTTNRHIPIDQQACQKYPTMCSAYHD